MKIKCQYKRGRSFEYKTKEYLENEGYFVFRSAGSHTPVDLIAIKTNNILFIQCKITGKISQSEKVEVVALASMVKAVPILAYNVNHKLVLKKLE